jgi:hypothetical protein
MPCCLPGRLLLIVLAQQRPLLVVATVRVPQQSVRHVPLAPPHHLSHQKLLQVVLGWAQTLQQLWMAWCLSPSGSTVLWAWALLVAPGRVASSVQSLLVARSAVKRRKAGRMLQLWRQRERVSRVQVRLTSVEEWGKGRTRRWMRLRLRHAPWLAIAMMRVWSPAAHQWRAQSLRLSTN